MGVELGLHEQLLFVGYLSRDGDLEDCYRAGDGFVFASRTETQGLVLPEAVALRRTRGLDCRYGYPRGPRRW